MYFKGEAEKFHQRYLKKRKKVAFEMNFQEYSGRVILTGNSVIEGTGGRTHVGTGQWSAWQECGGKGEHILRLSSDGFAVQGEGMAPGALPSTYTTLQSRETGQRTAYKQK